MIKNIYYKDILIYTIKKENNTITAWSTYLPFNFIHEDNKALSKINRKYINNQIRQNKKAINRIINKRNVFVKSLKALGYNVKKIGNDRFSIQTQNHYYSFYMASDEVCYFEKQLDMQIDGISNFNLFKKTIEQLLK